MKKVVRAQKMQKERKEDNTGLFIPAGVCLGLGIGFILNQVVGGLLVGLGLGFVGIAIARIMNVK